jgi:CzcA family heavy metal efflux pump
MIDAILQFSLRNRLLVLAAALIVFVFGVRKALDAPVDVFPDLTAPTVTVLADAHGMAPEEVEQLVTFPIETALNGATGVRRIRSSTALGIAVIWVEFDWDVEIPRARQIVTEKLQLVAPSLPATPVLAPVSSVMGEIMFLAVTSDTLDPRALRTIVDWRIRPRLLSISGVAQVVPIGGEKRQLELVLAPVRVDAYGLAIDAILAAAAGSNQNAAGGVLVENQREWVVRGIGRVQTPEDLAQTVIEIREDVPVTLGDLGDVRIGNAFKRGEASFGGKAAVVIGIQKQPDANTLELTGRIDAALDELESTLPEGVVLQRHVLRQSDFIEQAIDNVIAALRDGAFLVVLIVLPFLVSLRATLITALAIPLSLVVTVLALGAVGGGLDTMTLGGMAIAVGAVVDDAIIDVENVIRRLRENQRKPVELRRTALQVVLDASREIRASIVFATVIIALVFVPLFFLSGVEGRLLAPLGFAYVVALLASLVVALTVTPVACYYLLPSSKVVEHDREGWLSRTLSRLYAPVLSWALARWRLLAAFSILLVGAAGLGLGFAGRSFLPTFNEGALTVSVVAPPGISLARSDELGRWVERELLANEAVAATARRTGRADLDEHAQGVNASEIDVRLHADIDRDAVLAELREAVASVPGVVVVIGQPISHRIDHMMSGTRASIAVKLFGHDLPTLRKAAEATRDAMAEVEGVVDLAIEQQADVPQIHVRFDRRALARHGMTIRDASHVLETATLGTAVSQVVEGTAVYDIVVRYEPEVTEDLEAIRGLPVATPAGPVVPLRALARIERASGPSSISRENVQRKMVVMANVADRDLASVVEDVQQAIEAGVDVPGVRIEYGGQFESAIAASRTIGLLSLVVLLAVFILLSTSFGSVRDAILVLINLPLALVGGVVGVWLTGGVITVASLVGFIGLFGIAARNGIMLVSHVHQLVHVEGERDPVRAIERAAQERLAPIAMTALATGLGLAPLAAALGEAGSEIQAPMAIVILCGLAGSTLLNMLVIPSLYLRFGEAVRPLGRET